MNEREEAPPAPETAPRKTWEEWSRENDKLPGMTPSRALDKPIDIDKGDLS